MNFWVGLLFLIWVLAVLWWVIADLVERWEHRHDQFPFPVEELHLCLCGARTLRGAMPEVDGDVWHERGRCQPAVEVLWS